MKWTKKEVVSAVLGGLAIGVLVWFSAVVLVDSIRQIIEQAK